MKSAEEYFQKICLSIKDKDLHTLIRAEIEDHISEAKESGITTEQALEQLGDPILLGKSFEDIYQPKIDYLFITGLTLVFLMGILLQFQLVIMFTRVARWIDVAGCQVRPRRAGTSDQRPRSDDTAAFLGVRNVSFLCNCQNKPV